MMRRTTQLSAATVAATVAASGAAALVIALLGAPGPASAAGGTAELTSSHGIDHFNESAPHSPQVEQMLKDGVAKSPKAARSSVASPAAGVAGPTVQGIDLASQQHPKGAAINWPQVASDGYKFAFIKVSEGSYYVNPYYASDSVQAQAAGLFVAPYIFANPNYSGGALQADYGLDHAGYTPDGKILTPVLDIEYDPYFKQDHTNQCYGLTATQMVSWIKAFVAEIDRRTGQLPVFYTTAQWWKMCTRDTKAFAADPLWIAGDGSSGPIMPPSWSSYLYWQYATDTVAGINEGVDVDYINQAALALAEPATQSDAADSAAVSVTASALSGSTAAAYSATGLPPGLQIDPGTGVIGGTLTGPTGTFGVSVTATAAGTAASTQAFTWDVHGGISLGRMPGRAGSVGSPVRLQVAASDGLAGCTLSYSASGLPSGLSMNSCGLIYGWLQAARRYTVTVQVTDGSGAPLATRSFGWRVTPPGRSGPTGQIRLVRNGKCLTALSRTDIAIETCAAARARAASGQHWTIVSNGAIRLGTLCLSARSAKGSAAAALRLISCPNGGQRWQIGSNAVLVNLADGRCLSDTGTKNGSRAYAARCYATFNNTGSASIPGKNQVWTPPAGPLVSGIAGYCASDWHGARVAFGGVTLRGCGASTASPWTIEPDGAISAGSRCLGLNAGRTTPGTAVRLGRCRRSAEQVWQVSGGPGGVQLLNPASGLCLGDPGDRARAGNVLAIEPCAAGDPGVWWRLS
jgi:GH25 family lysozyme M1 (1,4-beta-N-acetylmuramidase)